MTIDGLDDAAIRDVLRHTRRVALVGASANPERAAHEIQGVLQDAGYIVTPVNPGLAGQELLGRTVVARLDDAVPLEMVDVFRASANVPPVVDDAIRLGAKVIWMQLGVIHEDAAVLARAAGITVVMDRCPFIEMRRLGIGKR